MKGIVLPTPALDRPDPKGISSWEMQVIDAVGNTIELWGFKANLGRIWAFVYLRGSAYTAREIEQAMGLSKGAVSMATREMEQWGVLHRVREGAQAWRFAAETDFLAMISKVIEAREARFLDRVREDLAQAELSARQEGSHDQIARIARIARMRRLADLVAKAVFVFLKTARFDVTGALGILADRRPSPAGQAEQRGKS
jgi:HTH-type transcriptional regulator, glycine betaine synthesis regulator